MSLKIYPECRYSGQEWLGNIPTGWSVSPVKHIARLLAGGTPESSNDLYWTEDGGTSWVSIGDMSGRDIVLSSSRHVTAEGMATKALPIAPPGTVLFAMYASVGEVSILGIHAAWNQAILGFAVNNDRAEPRFFFYALKAVYGWLPVLYRSNTQNNLNAEQVGNLVLPLPGITEQRAIISYLDQETEKLDSFIADQEELIALLIERRTATTTHAVTKGLDPEVPIRDSGIEWVGKIPSHWHLQRLWTLFDREKNVGHPDEQMLSVFRDHGVVPKDSMANLNQTAENRNIYQLVTPGWLVSNRMKAWQGSVGISSYRGIVSGHYICFRPKHNEHSPYLNYLFRSRAYAAGYNTISRGVRIGQAEIDNDEYRLLPVLLPPLGEQRRIAAYLDREIGDIDAAIADAREAIALSKERRAAVISAAVTGKIDVRDLMVPGSTTKMGAETVGVAS